MAAHRARVLTLLLDGILVGMFVSVLVTLPPPTGNETGRTFTLAAAGAPGTPYTWGGNAFGELGDGTTTPHGIARPLAAPTDVVDVHTGREHAVALRSDGTVVIWGSNQMGQLGIGTTGGSRPAPVAVPGLSDVTMVSTGHYHSLALRADGSVWTWGYNQAGQLGDGTTTTRNHPVRVPGTRTYATVAAGRDMSYAVATDGTVWAWGLNEDGQLGDGTTTARATPGRVGDLTGVTALAGGRDHGLALRDDGTVWAWGWNAYGQLGDGTLTDRTAPVQVTTGASAVAAGAHHSYALRADGRVLAWGRNYRNELGDGTTTQRTRPVTVLGVTGAVAIGSGRDHGLAALADGTVRAWGHNSSGQLGDGTTVSRSSAVTVTGVADARRVSGGAEFSVALSAPDGPPPPPPPPPPGSTTEFRAVTGVSRNAAGASVTVPATVREGDVLVLLVATNRLATTTTPAGWTLLGTATDDDLRSWVFTRTAVVGTAGSAVTVGLDATSKVDVTLAAYDGAAVTAVVSRVEPGSGTGHIAPAAAVTVPGSRVVHHWVTKVSTAVAWTVPPDLVTRRTGTSSGSGQACSLTADGGPADVGTWPAHVATAGAASGKAIGWTVVIPPD
ncbi:hypothetical protein RB608_16810 [Nocardioides sp. LHD-245]|uniref:RCC1 domain-containing protein n=1 Tax=Nocardioides sp. LHD-245 TaxID=3051387 RepID=UPI0027DF868A|nr:hypothetical protein [Nocardioides sp. LHD-245]